jgi:hypothetical protein
MLLYINRQSAAVRRQIYRRSKELQYVSLHILVLCHSLPPFSDESAGKGGASHGQDATLPDLSRSSRTRPITDDDLRMIEQEPFRILGEKVIVEGSDGEPGLFQIVGTVEMIGSGRHYRVRMDGCVDHVEMSHPELTAWLKNSFVVVDH